MAEQTNNRDMSDEPDRKDLEDRVDQLESTMSKMLPSRRDALKLGGAALVGGAAMSGSASAGGNEAGTIGTAGSPVDVESEDINNADTINTQNILPKDIANDYHYAAAFDGADADARLDDAIAKIGEGQTLFLEAARYTDNHTFKERTNIVGASMGFRQGSIRNCTFDLGSFCTIESLSISTNDGSTAIDMGFGSSANQILQFGFANGKIEANSSRAKLTQIQGIDVILNGSDCVVDSSTGVTVQDNGSGNVIGDIA